MVVQGLKPGKSLDYRSPAENLRTGKGEYAVQTGAEDFVTDLADQGLDIVGYIEGVLPGIALLEPAPYLHRIEILDETAVRLLRTDQVQLVVIDLLPSFRKPYKLLIISLMS